MSNSCYNRQCVVVFGTASLQQYIFQSNRLKENIGASHLAKHWLGKGLIETVQADTKEWDEYADNPLMGKSKKQEVNLIYLGGGNIALLCKNRKIAKEVVKAWSQELLKKAPGLRVVVGYGEVGNSHSLAEAYRDALKDLTRCEEALPFGSSLWGLPVVRTCITTGLPASILSMEDSEDNSKEQWISQAAARKREEVGTKTNLGYAQKAIADEFSLILKPNRERGLPQQRFATELEDLGGYEGQSHIAVVHADGNGIGEKLMEVVNESTDDNAQFLDHIRAFSASVTLLSQNTLKATLEYLKAALPLKSLHNPKNIFPLRPVVHGGDDLTFVCDGRLGLDLAGFYLKKFAEGTIKVCGKDQNVDACAGVAIVPTKFPFARAYGFADKLCGLAKGHRHVEGNSNGSWLDFQIIQEGATRSITALRDVQYRSLTEQVLPQRPYQVPKEWDDFVAILKEFQLAWPRNRAKRLLQALTQGPAVTERFVDGIRLPDVKGMDEIAKITGWKSEDEEKQSTPYFDPLEALDFYLEAKPTADDEDTKKEEDK